MSGGGDQEDTFIVKLRGLPWSACVDDILKFFKDCNVVGGKSGIHLTTSREGRPSGEAFIRLQSDEDVYRALQRDRDHMGNRYIEVFKVNRAEMDWVIKRSGPTSGTNDDGCVRLRGLPFGCSKEEIAQFFTGLEIVPNGITLLTDCSGRSSGEAYVQFVNKEVAEKALLKHREMIGHRYIEIFRSCLSEVNSILGIPSRRSSVNNVSGGYSTRPGPYDRGDRYGGVNSRFPPRGSRNFKGAFYDNGIAERKIGEFYPYERASGTWTTTTNNGDAMGGGGGGGGGGAGLGLGLGGLDGHSPYGISGWGSPNDRSNSSIATTTNNSGGGGGGGAHCVHMRGLPFKATQIDVADFFKPTVPISIRLLQDNSGRASGEADVEFASHEDAVRAMSKDKGHMQHRYIELFLNSSPVAGNSAAKYGVIGRQ